MFNSETPVSNPLEELVGEGKKFQTVEDLAKGKLEADTFIERLKSEAQEKAQDLFRLQTELEVLKRSAAPAAKPAEGDPPPAKAPDNTSVDLAARIKEELSLARQKEVEEANLNEVRQKLVGTFGSEAKASEVLKEKAAALGVSVQFLTDVAVKSPKAFYAQLGLDSSAQIATGIRPDVNTSSNFNTAGVKEGTYKWFDEIRKTNPAHYHSPQVQKQMFEAAKKMGASFYN